MNSNSIGAFFSAHKWIIPVAILSILAIMTITTYNDLARAENGIEAETAKMENALGAGYKKIGAQGLAVDKYKGILIDAINAGMTGRYGKDGAKGAFLWIQENHPNLEAKALEALQVAIEVTFNKFEAAQNARIDKINKYEDRLDTFPSNMVAGVFGFPKLDLAEYKQVISSSEAKEAMTTKELPAPQF